MKIQKCHIPNVEESIKTYARGNNDAPGITEYVATINTIIRVALEYSLYITLGTK